MLSKTEFQRLLKNPTAQTLDDIMLLESVVKKYPFFSIGHVLTANGVQLLAPSVAGDAIRQAAIYALNRNVLRQMIENEISWGDFYSMTKQDVPEAAVHAVIAEKVVNEISSVQERMLDTKQEEITLEIPSLEEEIIDTFIKNEPRISKLPIQTVEDEEENLVDLGEKSTQLQSFPFTETYAKILVIQRKFDKAIEVYTHLIGKYPEKSSYFANQIGAIRDLLKS
ncbi:MAG: hypothetical protein ACK4R6_00430 [Spirosomataceae bacterium]